LNLLGAVSASMAGRAVRRLVPLVAGASLLLGAASVPSVAQTAERAVPTGQPASVAVPAQASLAAAQVAVNPLAGRPWGVYKGLTDSSWLPYANSTGTNRTLLAKIALRPKATWFGAWMPNADIAAIVRDYISV
jgi:endoglucanase